MTEAKRLTDEQLTQIREWMAKRAGDSNLSYDEGIILLLLGHLASLTPPTPEEVARLAETCGAGISPLAFENMGTIISAREALAVAMASLCGVVGGAKGGETAGTTDADFATVRNTLAGSPGAADYDTAYRALVRIALDAKALNPWRADAWKYRAACERAADVSTLAKVSFEAWRAHRGPSRLTEEQAQAGAVARYVLGLTLDMPPSGPGGGERLTDPVLTDRMDYPMPDDDDTSPAISAAEAWAQAERQNDAQRRAWAADALQRPRAPTPTPEGEALTGWRTCANASCTHPPCAPDATRCTACGWELAGRQVPTGTLVAVSPSFVKLLPHAPATGLPPGPLGSMDAGALEGAPLPPRVSPLEPLFGAEIGDIAAPVMAWEGDGVRVLADGTFSELGQEAGDAYCAEVLARALAEAKRELDEAPLLVRKHNGEKVSASLGLRPVPAPLAYADVVRLVQSCKALLANVHIHAGDAVREQDVSAVVDVHNALVDVWQAVASLEGDAAQVLEKVAKEAAQLGAEAMRERAEVVLYEAAASTRHPEQRDRLLSLGHTIGALTLEDK